MIVKKNINRVYYLFLFSHLVIWTIAPSLTNVNLPLDTIEALAWGSNLEWGFNKHPPLSAFAVEIFYNIFGRQDWAYYFLSQLFVITAFIAVFKFAYEFFNDLNLALISVLLLEGIFFFNYTSPEFNVNIAQLPFWAISVFLTWRCIKYNKVTDYAFLGLTMGLGFLSKYLFLYLIVSIKLLFIKLLINKKIKSFNFLITAPVALVVIFPHLLWLVDNNYVTLNYGLNRAQGGSDFINHIVFPLTFILKQLVLLLPLFIMTFFLLKKNKISKIKLEEKTIFLIFICFLPILFMIMTSTILGAKIRTMWMTPFYLFAGVAIIHFFRMNIEKKNFRRFNIIFLCFFFISPLTYSIVSLSNDFKRTDYPGQEIARLVQNKWDNNFRNEIKVVIGDEWFAGNLSYHLESRPKWIIELKNDLKILDKNDGIIYAGNPKILQDICPGIYGTIKPVGYCMIGIK